MGKMIKKSLAIIGLFRLYAAGVLLKIGRRSRVSTWRMNGKRGCLVDIGHSCVLETGVFMERAGAVFSVGDRTFIGGRGVFTIFESVKIGSDVMISWGCTIADHDSHSLDFRHRARDVENWLEGRKDWSHVRSAPVNIGNKVWIGFNCSVLKGVTVGEGAVIAANSNVTRDVPPWTLVAGNPARFIRQLDPS